MEVWKDIPNYEGFYQASSLGNIRSLPRATTKGRVMKPYVNGRNNYCYIALSKNGEIKTKRVHILIAATFLGEKEEGYQVNHIDGDKTNNAVENLEYCTQSENMKHAYRLGLEKPRGIKVIDLDTLQVYETASKAGRTVSSSKNCGSLVQRVCRGERSHYRNHHFAYYDDYINNTIPEYKGIVKKKASVTLWR